MVNNLILCIIGIILVILVIVLSAYIFNNKKHLKHRLWSFIIPMSIFVAYCVIHEKFIAAILVGILSTILVFSIRLITKNQLIIKPKEQRLY